MLGQSRNKWNPLVATPSLCRFFSAFWLQYIQIVYILYDTVRIRTFQSTNRTTMTTTTVTSRQKTCPCKLCNLQTCLFFFINFHFHSLLSVSFLQKLLHIRYLCSLCYSFQIETFQLVIGIQFFLTYANSQRNDNKLNLE